MKFSNKRCTVAKTKSKNISMISCYIIRFLTVFIALIAAYLHLIHISAMHENDLFFSHLSSRERELTFRTESGFYYSYYKQLLLTPSLLDGWHSLLVDTRSEVQNCRNSSNTFANQCPTLNAMQRFNLYPELILAIAYRWAVSYNLLHHECYYVNRDPPNGPPLGLAVKPEEFVRVLSNTSIELVARDKLYIKEESVLSCVGSAEPSYFYTYSVFVLAGLILISLAWSGRTICSDWSAPNNDLQSTSWLSIWGCLLPVLAYFFNHREATRVQWVQPLRENFAYPFFTLQQAWLLATLRRSSSTTDNLPTLSIALHALILLLFQLPWQFAQFALATQVASLFGATLISLVLYPKPSVAGLNLIGQMRRIVFGHLFALLANFVLQFGNRLLISSGYLAGLIGVLVSLFYLCRKYSNLLSPKYKDSTSTEEWLSPQILIPILFKSLLLALCTTLCVTLLVTRILFPSEETNDGGHIIDILREKFYPNRQFRTFHTRMYTCAAEFDFLGLVALEQPIQTGVLPAAIFLTMLTMGTILVRLCSPRLFDLPNSNEDNRSRYIFADFLSLFLIMQLCFFSLMAGLIMRLKLFWTPQLCLTLALLAQPHRWRHFFDYIHTLSAPSNPPASTAKEKGRSSSSFTFLSLVPHLLVVSFIAFMIPPGWKNLENEWAIRGQFSDYNSEILLDWFSSLPPRSPSKFQENSSFLSLPWVITGPMSTLGNLRLTLPSTAPYPNTQQPLQTKWTEPAGFAFTNHPHYENAQLRQRTILAYSIYSRLSLKQVWDIYRHQLQANFVIMDAHGCPPRDGCSNSDMFDLVHPHLTGKPALCDSLLHPNVSRWGQTPPDWKPYFDVVFVDLRSKRVVLYVRP